MEVCQMKENELEVEERKLINGEITDSKQSAQIEKKLEEKVIEKKHSWSFSQEIKNLHSKWENLLKQSKENRLSVKDLIEEVRKIREQIDSIRLSSNPFKQKAYQNNEAKVNQLMAEINTKLQGN